MSDFTSDATTSSISDPSKRVRYSTGLVLGVDEFNQDQAYFIERDRLLSRALHGYGVVHGLHVHVDTSEDLTQIRVEPGLAIEPSGQHVCVERAQCAVLTRWLADRSVDDLGLSNGVTAEPPEEEEGGATEITWPREVCLSVVLRYGTCATDFVPLPGEPCRSAEEARAASRLADDASLALEFEADRPPQIEEHAIRLLGQLLRALEVRATGASLSADTLRALVEAIPEALVTVDEDGHVSIAEDASLASLAEAAEVTDADGVVLPENGDGEPFLRIGPGSEAEMVRVFEEAWVTHARQTLLTTGVDAETSRPTGRGGDDRCQPVPPADDGVVLGTVCLSVEPDGDGGLQPATEDGEVDVDALTLSTEHRSTLVASRVLQETGLFDRMPVGGDGDGTLAGSPAGGDLTGTYPDPHVAGLREEPLVMEPSEAPDLADGHVLTYDGSTWRPEPLPELPSESDAVPSNAEIDLTRIVALSWEHQRLYEDPQALELELDGFDGAPAPALGVAFGPQATRPDPGSTLESPEEGVLASTLTAETVRVYVEWTDAQFAGLNRRLRVQPRAVLPLRTVQIGDQRRVVGGTVDREGRIVRGVAFLFPEEIEFGGDALSVDVLLRGDFILDDREKAIDAEFVRGALPTGDRASEGRASEAGVQGGRFESWLYLRSRPEYVERVPPPEFEVVNLNTAEFDDLVRLPGVGDTIAERILTFREEREEEITDPHQLTDVSGLSETQIDEWEGLIEPPIEPPE